MQVSDREARKDGEEQEMAWQIGVDVGGTFTDLLARISQRCGCIGTLDLRKSCCENGLSRRQGEPDADRV